MSKSQTLRDLVMERLVVAADEIFALFERTIAEYEEESLRSKQLLETHNKGFQTLSVNLEVVPSPEQALCIKQEAEPSLEFPLTSVSVKTENNVEKSFLLQQEPPEEDREEPGCSLYLQSDKDKQTYSCSDTDDSDDWETSAKRTTRFGQKSETVQRKDSKRGVQTILVNKEVCPALLQKRPTVKNKEEGLGEQLREEKPGCSSDVTNLQSNSGAHCSSDTKDSDHWEPPECATVTMETDGHSLNQAHIKDSERGVQSHLVRREMRRRLLQRATEETDREQLTEETAGSDSGAHCRSEDWDPGLLQEWMETAAGEHKSNNNRIRGLTPKNYLKRHMSTPSPEKSSTCPECGLKLKHPRNLYRHISAVHRGDRPYSCSICEKAFAQKSDFIKHMRTHTGEKPYSCPMCDKTFAQKIHFIFHMRTHTGERPFSCSVCQKHFASKENLLKHMTRMHRNHAAVQNSENDLM